MIIWNFFASFAYDEIYLDSNCVWHQAARMQVGTALKSEDLDAVLSQFPPLSAAKKPDGLDGPKFPFTVAQMTALDTLPIFHTGTRLLGQLIQSFAVSDLSNYAAAYNTMMNERERDKQVIYVAVDGVAPISKLSVQLGRRRERSQLESRASFLRPSLIASGGVDADSAGSASNSLQGTFQSCLLTPGNKFMSLLDRQTMRILCDYLLTQNFSHSSRRINFVFDPSTRPGEGDLKIFNAIKRSYEKQQASRPLDAGNDRRKRLIMSVDSDTILGSIALGLPNVFCKDATGFGNFFNGTTFSCDTFFAHLESVFSKIMEKESSTVRQRILANIRLDFVFLTMCGGTDYFPSIKDYNISHFWKTYVHLRLNCPLNENGGGEKAFEWLINAEEKALNVQAVLHLIEHVLRARDAGAVLSHFSRRSNPSSDDFELLYFSRSNPENEGGSEMEHSCVSTLDYFSNLLKTLHSFITAENIDFFSNFTSSTGPSLEQIVCTFRELLAQGTSKIQLMLPTVYSEEDITGTVVPLVSSLLLLPGPLALRMLPSFTHAIIHEKAWEIGDPVKRWKFVLESLGPLKSKLTPQERQIYLPRASLVNISLHTTSTSVRQPFSNDIKNRFFEEYGSEKLMLDRPSPAAVVMSSTDGNTILNDLGIHGVGIADEPVSYVYTSKMSKWID